MSNNKSSTKIALGGANASAKKQVEAEHLEEFEKKLELLRRTTGIREADVTEYQKAEILRQSISDVRSRAAVQEDKRLSPRKYYGNVKSKVGGNMKSQKSAKKRQMQVAIDNAQRDELTGSPSKGNLSPARSRQTQVYTTEERLSLAGGVSPYKKNGTAVRESPVRARNESPSHKINQRMTEIDQKQAEIDGLKAELANSSWRQRQSFVNSSANKNIRGSTYSQSYSKQENIDIAQPEPVNVEIRRGPEESEKAQTRMDSFVEATNEDQFAHLQHREVPAQAAKKIPSANAPAASATANDQQINEILEVRQNSVTVTEGSIYFEESRQAKLQNALQTPPVAELNEPQPTPQSQAPAPEDEPERVIVDNHQEVETQHIRETSEPEVASRQRGRVIKKKTKAKQSFAGNPAVGGGVAYFDPQAYQASADPNTKSVQVQQQSQVGRASPRKSVTSVPGSKFTKKSQAAFSDSLYRGVSPSKQRMNGIEPKSQSSGTQVYTKKKSTKKAKAFAGAPPQQSADNIERLSETKQVKMQQPVYSQVNISTPDLNDSYAVRDSQPAEVREVAEQREYSPVKNQQSPQKAQVTVTQSAEFANGTSNLPSNHKFRNHDLEAKTAEIQAEFDRILNSQDNLGRMSPRKSAAKGDGETGQDMDGFYKVMGEFYKSGDVKRHSSPTKRLMQQKDAAWTHKAVLYKDHRPRDDTYGITYVTSPDKLYRIEPVGGEINYDLAHKNPLKFYDKVMKQDINQYKVRKSKIFDEEQQKKIDNAIANNTRVPKKKKAPLEMTSKVTKRKIGRILLAVQTKLQDMIQSKIVTDMNQEDVAAALQDTAVKQVVQKHVANEGIQLVRRDSLQPVFRREMSLYGEKGDRAVNESPGGIEEAAHHDIEPEDAMLQVNTTAAKEIRHSVEEFKQRREVSEL